MALEKHMDRLWAVLLPERTSGRVAYDVYGDIVGTLAGSSGYVDF